MEKQRNKAIGNILKASREKKGLSQQDVADYVGVSKSGVSRWESGEVGNIGRSKIQLLSEILNISPVAIVLGEVESRGMETSEIAQWVERNKKKLSSLNKEDSQKLIKLIEVYLD